MIRIVRCVIPNSAPNRRWRGRFRCRSCVGGTQLFRSTMKHLTQTMKSSLIITLASLVGTMLVVAQEQAIVQSADVLDYGIYRIELTGEHVPMPSAGAGAVQPASRVVLVAQTN